MPIPAHRRELGVTKEQHPIRNRDTGAKNVELDRRCAMTARMFKLGWSSDKIASWTDGK